MESELFNILLEYLRNQLNTANIQYKEKPVKIPKGLGADKCVFTLNNAPEQLSKPLLVRLKEKQKSKTQYTTWDIRLQECSLHVAIRVF